MIGRGGRILRGAIACASACAALLAEPSWGAHVTATPPATSAPVGDASVNASRADGRPLPRTVLALVDLREEESIRLTRIHSMVEMPLNQLGVDVVYWDVANGLPDIERWPGLRGVITWFTSGPFKEPRAYLNWLMAAMDRGLRVVALGAPGLRDAVDGTSQPVALINRFYGRMGIRDDDGYTDLTYRVKPVVADALVGYERSLDGALPGYPLLRLIDPRFTTHLALRRDGDPGSDSHLIVTGPTGGIATEGFIRYYDAEFNRKTWIIDPFAFFRLAFATDELPKPDTTTLSNRRIYFSHIDGDGWRNQTEVPPFSKKRVLSSDVVRRLLIEPYPDLPVSVAPIVGDLDPSMAGTPEAVEVARALFALPQVEVASHTWSHPFDWGFFKDYTEKKEERFHAQGITRRGGAELVAGLFGRKTNTFYESGGEGANLPAVKDGEDGDGGEGGIGHYERPRAFMETPFDLTAEIAGSLAFMDTLAPPGKPKARLIQWSGNTDPWEGAVAAVRKAGALNMNGGDSRFDPEYPSYTSVPSIGKPVGVERQIYSGASNENTYTDLWSARFFGFKNLAHTVINTECPIRVKPFNIYYHTYSGQKVASVQAVRSNLELARASEIAPIMAARYVEIANSFYSTTFTPDGERRWRVGNRGGLQTIRFDHASFTGVDFGRSEGIIGQRHHQGSLYIALDPTAVEPVVALTEFDRADVAPTAPRPYLENARWELSGLRIEGQSWRFTTWGYGAGEMSWYVPWPGRYDITVTRRGAPLWRGQALASSLDHLLTLSLPVDAIDPVDVSIRPTPGGG